ncbi:phosphoribosylamine--glycine ligase [Clostridium mediterraneense]|uniref:phosphoribosylamine--glycine ligase n=1 Tax=Clostridium mediterraneense TaxID=1805472 RepID=UPI0008364F74|nr:phosphoribosylamine--glycine ligase [Clostridium mediterraneense]
MKILLIGSGGREHAIARKFAQNNKVQKIYCAPGNGGTALEQKCENINIIGMNELVKFAKDNKIFLTFVGPEVPLIDGIVDLFNKENLRIFGPSKKAAMLEGSKSFSKEFMKKYNVKTAKYEVFTEANEALRYLKNQEFPIVIKADGLAAGKGVYICDSLEEANSAVKDIMIDDIFTGAGNKIVVEEFLEGIEASILSITDGEVILPFVSAKDHKQIFDGGKGPNTGGMGVIAPNPYVTDKVKKEFESEIMNPTLLGLREENLDFKGIIFFGIMITKKGTYLLEYNVRMGDPETQSVLELMDSDFLELVNHSIDKNLKNFNLKWKDEYCCNVVLASKGYPGKIEKGFEIFIDKAVKNNIIIAGGELKENKLVTSGGRVLSVIEIAKTLEEAINKTYLKVEEVNFYGKYYRKDIGR